MFNIINKILFCAKVILLLIVFTLTLYILFMMNSYYHSGLLNIISVSIPMLLVLIIFVVSFFFNEGNNNTLFNVCCFLAFLAIIIIDVRAIVDKNMVLITRGGINFYFFQNQIVQIKILSYLVFLGNVLLIYKEKHNLKLEIHS